MLCLMVSFLRVAVELEAQGQEKLVLKIGCAAR